MSLSKILSFPIQYTFLIILFLDISIMSSILFSLLHMFSIPGKTVIIIYHLSTMGSLFFPNPMSFFHFYTISFLPVTFIYTPNISIVHLETISSNYWNRNIIKYERMLWSHILFVKQLRFLLQIIVQ